MNKEAGQNPQIISRRIRYRDDLDPEKLEWLIWLSHNWKWHFEVNRHSDLNSTQASSRIRKKVQASGNREELTPTSDNWWNASWWNKSWWERSTWTWNDEVWGFLNSRSRTHVHTPCRTHIFFAHFLCVTYRQSRTRMAQGVCSVSHIYLHLAFSVLMFHPPSLLFPHGHFDTHVPVRTVFVELYPTQKRGSSAPPHERRGVWPPGRSCALHRLWARRVWQDHFCRRWHDAHQRPEP